MQKKKITKVISRKDKTSIRKASTSKVSHKRTSQRKVVVYEKESNPWIWAQSYTSLLLGVVVVIIGVLFVATLVKVRHTQQTSSISTIAQPTPTTTMPQPQMYVVKEGDDLWHISEQFYKSGYNYVDIAKANNLENPGSINAGDKLIIPSITPTPSQIGMKSELTTQTVQTSSDAITTSTYTIQKGDSLWDIAVRAYHDGYKWTEIAKANNFENPGMIFSGNVLKIPRE